MASESEASAAESAGEEDGEASDAGRSDEDESEAEDDLFDSEEEEEISKRVLEDERNAARGGKQLGGKRAGTGKAEKTTVSTRSSRSRASKYDSGSEDGEEVS